MALLFRRDCAIQYAIHKAGDGGHRRFQLMGYIGHEAAAHHLHRGEGNRHVIKCQGQLGHLILPVHRYARTEIPLGETAGCRRHLPQRPHKAIGQHIHRRAGEHQRPQRRHQIDLEIGSQRLHHRGDRRRDKHIAQHTAVDQDRRGRIVASGAEQTVERAHLEVAFTDVGHQRCRRRIADIGGMDAVRAQQHLAAAVGHQHRGINGIGNDPQHGRQCPLVKLIHHRAAAGNGRLGGGVFGVRCDAGSVLQQQLFFILGHRTGKQQQLQHRHDQKAGKDDQGNNRKVF